MARVTVEDCMKVIPSRFELVVLAAGLFPKIPLIFCVNLVMLSSILSIVESAIITKL